MKERARNFQTLTHFLSASKGEQVCYVEMSREMGTCRDW